MKTTFAVLMILAWLCVIFGVVALVQGNPSAIVFGPAGTLLSTAAWYIRRTGERDRRFAR